MGNLLYIVAVVLIIGWAVGFFAFSAGGIIHILLVIAVITELYERIKSHNNPTQMKPMIEQTQSGMKIGERGFTARPDRRALDHIKSIIYR